MIEKQLDKILDQETKKYHSWKDSFNHLRKFQKKNGHTWISKKSKNKKDRVVSQWAVIQRTLIRKGKLHPLRLKLLQSINFKIDYYDFNDKISLSVRNERAVNKSPFNAQLKLVLQWREKHGIWPSQRKIANKEERYLGWVVRDWRIKRKLRSEQMDILDSHGFIWDLSKHDFIKKIERIKAFKEKFGTYRIDRKKATEYDRKTSVFISVLRTSKANKEQWKLDIIKELELEPIRIR